VPEYGSGYFGDNADAGLSRLEFAAAGALTPVAVVRASATTGTPPLTVELSGADSRAPGLVTRGVHDDLRGLFYAVELSHTDAGGPDGAPAATAREGIRLPIVPAPSSPSGAFL
jgi:hypothetical protein